MIELPLNYPWKTCVKLLGPSDELPIPDTVNRLFLDLETTSGDPKLKSINPHRHCKILGVAVLFDDQFSPYYVPLRHYYINSDGAHVLRNGDCANVGTEKVYDWLRILLSTAKCWVNQNIKYDIHCLWNEARIRPSCKLVDTLILAKLSENEEKLNYSLDNIMKMFNIDITEYEHALQQYLGKNKDYGLVPADKMATYAGIDVLSCRYIHRNIQISSECARVLEMEQQLLPELVRIEQVGIRTDTDKLVKDYQEMIPVQKERIQRIRNISGYQEFDPSCTKSKEELFCSVLDWNIDYTAKSQQRFEETGNSNDLSHSFAYDSLLRHRLKNPELVDTWFEYQDFQKILTSFIGPYLEQHVDELDLLKGNFNQIVRTGRMSCTDPPMQTLPAYVKSYILPYSEDYTLVEFDLSQIEFRVIVHYIDNQKAIQAYKTNPNTDFHTLMAHECGIDRTAAKRVNFMLGYGGGKLKTIALLSELLPMCEKLITYDQITTRALEVYSKYHSTLPELKSTSYRAGDVLRSRGYVRTLLGRHRNIPKQFHFKAFNSIAQGSAADFQKDITLRLRKFLSTDCILHLLVHDSWIFSIRKEHVDELIPLIKEEIERPIEDIDFSVPILSSVKQSDENWKECA